MAITDAPGGDFAVADEAMDVVGGAVGDFGSDGEGNEICGDAKLADGAGEVAGGEAIGESAKLGELGGRDVRRGGGGGAGHESMVSRRWGNRGKSGENGLLACPRTNRGGPGDT